jgi:hypothetical protein
MTICGTPGVIETQTGTFSARSRALCGLTLKMGLVVYRGINLLQIPTSRQRTPRCYGRRSCPLSAVVALIIGLLIYDVCDDRNFSNLLQFSKNEWRR